jgi:hypothetical protein
MRPSAAGARARPAPPAALFKGGAKAKAAPKPAKGKGAAEEEVDKRSWYQQTREDARPSRGAGWTTRDEIEFRRQASEQRLAYRTVDEKRTNPKPTNRLTNQPLTPRVTTHIAGQLHGQQRRRPQGLVH